MTAWIHAYKTLLQIRECTDWLLSAIRRQGAFSTKFTNQIYILNINGKEKILLLLSLINF